MTWKGLQPGWVPVKAFSHGYLACCQLDTDRLKGLAGMHPCSRLLCTCMGMWAWPPGWVDLLVLQQPPDMSSSQCTHSM